MIPGSLAKRYARALFELSTSEVQRDKIQSNLDDFAVASRVKDTVSGETLMDILSASYIPVSQRKAAAGALCKRLMADATASKFLALLVEKGRISGLDSIARAYREMADQAAGRLRAHIRSAQPMAGSAVQQIKGALEKATGKTIIIDSSVEPELIGGVIAQVGSMTVDGSVATSLENLRTSLRNQ